MSDLEGKVALVTGAGRGIGKATARLLAQKGMRVAVNDVDPNLAEGVERDLSAEGLSVSAMPGDVTRQAQVAEDRGPQRGSGEQQDEAENHPEGAQPALAGAPQRHEEGRRDAGRGSVDRRL